LLLKGHSVSTAAKYDAIFGLQNCEKKGYAKAWELGELGEMQVTWPLELPEVGGGEKLSSGINNKSHLRDRDTG